MFHACSALVSSTGMHGPTSTGSVLGFPALQCKRFQWMFLKLVTRTGINCSVVLGLIFYMCIAVSLMGKISSKSSAVVLGRFSFKLRLSKFRFLCGTSILMLVQSVLGIIAQLHLCRLAQSHWRSGQLCEAALFFSKWDHGRTW